MAYFITEPLAGSDDVVVSVYKNTGEYVGNIIYDRYKSVSYTHLRAHET